MGNLVITINRNTYLDSKNNVEVITIDSVDNVEIGVIVHGRRMMNNQV